MTDSPVANSDFHVDEYTSHTKLKPTLDEIQKRFSSSVEELIAWRNALLYRYSAIRDSSVTVEVTDYDSEMQVLPLSRKWLTDLPFNLVKTVIRIFSDSSKRITVTLYYVPSQSYGTLLCQGKDCVQWDSHECESLKNLITEYVASQDSAVFLASLLKVPLIFLQPYERLTLQPPDVTLNRHGCVGCDDDVQSSSSTPTPETTTSQAQDLQSLLSCDQTHQSFNDVIIFPPTPPVTKSTVNKSQQATPRGFKLKKRRRRTLFLSPIQEKSLSTSLIRSCTQKLNQFELSLEELTNAHQNTKDALASLIEDAKVAIKNEIKSYQNERNYSMKENLQTKISDLEKTVESLKKENHSLKTQLGTIQSELKRHKSKQVCDAFTQSVSPPHPEQSGVVSNPPKTNATVSNGQAVKEEKQKKDPVFTSQAGTTASCNFPVTKFHCHRKSTTIAEGTDETRLVEYSVPVTNPFSPLSQEPTFGSSSESLSAELNLTAQNSGTHSVGHSTTHHSDSDSPSTLKHDKVTKSKPTVKEILNNITIPDNQSSVLIGDSTIRFINPRRLAPRQETLCKVCVSGLSVKELNEWLLSQSPFPSIRFLILHVGVNDCPSGHITTDQWCELISLCRKDFPTLRADAQLHHSC